MNRIKEFRKRKKLSQCDIARIMKIKQNTFSQWENDIRMPNIRQVLKLAEILETTVESLYKDKIMQLFNMQDYAKELLLSSITERQEENARSFLERINLELKTLYIPTPIENV